MIFNPVMNRELDCLRQTSDELSRWRTDHLAAAQVGHIEEAIALFLHIHRRMTHWNQQYAHSIQEGKRQYDQIEQDQIEAMFRELNRGSLQACELAVKFVPMGLQVAGLAELQSAVQRSPFNGVTSQELSQGYQEALRGDYVPGEKVRDEIQRRLLQARGGTAL